MQPWVQIVLTGAFTLLLITPYTHWLIKRREHRAFERSEMAQAERALRARFDDVAAALERFESARDFCWEAIKQCNYEVPPAPAGEKSVVETLNDRAEAFAVAVARARLGSSRTISALTFLGFPKPCPPRLGVRERSACWRWRTPCSTASRPTRRSTLAVT
jgi:hypothetical protein